MARMRYLKPEFWTDSKVVRMSPWARMLFQGSWNFAICDAGHLDDDAMALKLKVLPADPIDADEILDEVVQADLLLRKTLPSGKTYLQVRTLAQHQKVDSRWAPRCPYCNAEAAAELSETREASPKLPGTLRDSGKEGIGGEGRGDRKESSSEIADAITDDPAEEDPAKDESTPVRDDVEHLCNVLVELMVANGCRKPNITKRWRNETRLLLDRDQVRADLAEHVLRWSQADQFWKTNIQSMPKFREKFDVLRLQRREEHEKAQNGRGGPPQQRRAAPMPYDPFAESAAS